MAPQLRKNGLLNMIEWIDQSMKDKDGLYIYEVNSILGIKIRNTFKFHRWSQAWMFLALTELYKKKYSYDG